VPDRPTKAQAAAALTLIRNTFKTFCFADAETIEDGRSGVAVVDVSRPPGRDESAFLVSSLTAVCRLSLHLAPGVLLRAAPVSVRAPVRGSSRGVSASSPSGANRTPSPLAPPRRNWKSGSPPS
jgi:hypothetical protein